ncbi:LIC_10091 family protein [Candidatus Protochlamydia sp. R18]|uniref:LIC_10091 family protein n=1 Tax=Candidatus Protochlamydia sp. R18 TaxID=1353977 RepID=UPI0005A79EE9|nr:hypothetical protein [Candidatus Protochlamydia sp. R18]
MSLIQAISTCTHLICFPWKYQKNNSRKIAAWAAFFFIGWLYHPFKAANRYYEKLTDQGKTYFIGKKILLKKPISEKLASFNNSHVQGQIYGIYITTNETNLAATYQRLREAPQANEKQTIHIGCATWHNFDMICERKSTYGLIVDFNPKNAAFIKKTIDIINASNTRKVFKQSMIDYLNSLQEEEKNLFFHTDQQGLPTDKIEQELSREGSWLQSEESYLFIRKLVSEGHLIAITEDITNFEKFAGIRKFLDHNNIAIDTLYLSNICNFMHTDNDKYAFTKSIKSMLQRDTILINCPKLRQINTEYLTILHQKTILGREVLASTFDNEELFEVVI